MLNVKKTILKYFPIDRYLSKHSYSQEGEDMVLWSFFEAKKNYKGCYIDVGAHHPYRYSNTLFFYKKGWRGINIEPTPGAIKSFKILRPGDINLNVGISSKQESLLFYCFNEPALNGFSREMSEDRDSTPDRYKIIKKIKVQTIPLSDILDTHLIAGQQIDFLSVDVEGFDLAVLKSNDWEKYKPSFILIEDRIDFENIASSEVYSYLKEQGYQLVAKTLRTLFFRYSS